MDFFSLICRNFSTVSLFCLYFCVGCSWVEDGVNQSNSKEPVNVTAASVCTDTFGSFSENIHLSVSTDQMAILLEYFRDKGAKPPTASFISDPEVRDLIHSLAVQAWDRSLTFAAKDEFLKDKMEIPFYEEFIMRTFRVLGSQGNNGDCFMGYFNYLYDYFEFGYNGSQQFVSRISIQKEFLTCDTPLEISFCLDDRTPESPSGDFDDDDD